MLLCLSQQRTEGRVSWLKGDSAAKAENLCLLSSRSTTGLALLQPASHVRDTRAPEEEDLCPHSLSLFLAHPGCLLVSASEFSISMVNALSLPLRLKSIYLLAPGLGLYFASDRCQLLISGVASLGT